MEFLRAVQIQPLQAIKKYVASYGIPKDSEWLDYKILTKALECKRIDVAKYLIENDCRVCKPAELAEAENTPLHYAAELEDMKLVEELLNRKADLTAVNQHGETPIHIAFIKATFDKTPSGNAIIEFMINVVKAFQHSQDQIIDYLLSLLNSKTQNLNQISSSGLSHLHIACARKKIKLVKNILLKNRADVNQAVDANAENWAGYLPLHFAAESQCKETLKLLMEKGSNVEHQATNGMTPLHIALHNENYMKKLDFRKKITVVDLLYEAFNLETKENDVVDSFGMSLLHIACSRNDVKIVKKFLDKGVDVNKQLKKNEFKFSRCSPLHFAARYKCKEVAELLIQYGADVNCTTYHHGTPLHLAVDNGDDEMIDLLLKHKADAKIMRPCDKSTVLHILCNYEIRDDREMQDKCNQSHEFVWGYLSSRGMIDCYIKKFIVLGVNVNAKDKEGNTALHVACRQLREGENCIDHLLKFGADINIENKEGQVAFQNTIDCQGYRMNGETFMKLYHYVQKFKEVGMKVNPKNYQFCKQLLEETEECDPDSKAFTKRDMAKKKRQRQNEIEKLKEVMIDGTTSLFDVLLMDSNKLIDYCENEELKKIVKMKGLCKTYPWYGHLLWLQVQIGLAAKKRNGKEAAIIQANDN